MQELSPAEVMALKPNIEMDVALASMKMDSRYSFQILAPNDVPQHTIEFWYENGVLKGSYSTEHKKQPMLELTRNGCDITFKAYAGSHGDELFYTKLHRYMGGIMLGTTQQLRFDEVFSPSPVLCISADPGWELIR